MGMESDDMALGFKSNNIIEPHPKKTRANVPMYSAKHFLNKLLIILKN